MNWILKLFFFVAIGLTSVRGQNETESRQFSCFVWGDLGVGKVYYSDREGPKELYFTGKRRTDYYPIPVSDTFKLFSMKEVDGKASYEVIGETAIKTKSKRLLLVVERNSEANKTQPGYLPLSITVLDDSIGSFPGGSTKFINLTALPLAAEINGTKGLVPSKRFKLIRPSIPENGGFVPLFVKYGKRSIYETRIFCQIGERRIVFIRANPKKDPRRPVLIDFLPQIVGPSFSDE